MMKIRTHNLAVLQQQEAELVATLDAVRKAIKNILSKMPAEARGGAKFKSTAPADVIGSFMAEVLDGLAVQFSSVEVFERAKQMQPDFDRAVLERAMNKLQRTGAIKKIQAGRGWHPARFQKASRH